MLRIRRANIHDARLRGTTIRELAEFRVTKRLRLLAEKSS
jgi:hypothetical protein